MGKADFITAMLCRMCFPQNSISSVRYLFLLFNKLKELSLTASVKLT